MAATGASLLHATTSRSHEVDSLEERASRSLPTLYFTAFAAAIEWSIYLPTLPMLVVQAVGQLPSKLGLLLSIFAAASLFSFFVHPYLHLGLPHVTTRAWLCLALGLRTLSGARAPPIQPLRPPLSRLPTCDALPTPPTPSRSPPCVLHPALPLPPHATAHRGATRRCVRARRHTRGAAVGHGGAEKRVLRTVVHDGAQAAVHLARAARAVVQFVRNFAFVGRCGCRAIQETTGSRRTPLHPLPSPPGRPYWKPGRNTASGSLTSW